MQPTSLAACAAVFMATASACGAAPLFGANFDNGPVTISTADSNFVDTITNVAKQSDQLLTPKALAAPFTATVTYMGVPHDVTLTPSFKAGQLSLRMRSVAFDATFTGSSAKEVQDKLEDYLNANGLAIIAKFDAASAFQSAFAITDGNPASTTASAARSVFLRAGLPPLTESGARAAGTSSLSLSRGTLEAEIAGQTYRGEQVRADAVLFDRRLNERLRIALPVNGEYTQIEGTEVFGGGATFLAEITLARASAAQPFGWRITPVIGAQGRVSFDAVSGGLSWHTGLVNAVDWRISERFTLTLINQATLHRDIPVELGDYATENGIHQTIVKNGLALTMHLSPRWNSNVYVADTRFLEEASVDSYRTVGASVEYRAGEHASAGVGVEADFASEYRSLLGRVSFNWRW